ncbi:hypothetical protein HK100_010483 [Physocladia obscura]|uniref:Uncharacterized protein n=1 Tax=Physocladia obscura TaxID=109957 RepID=A0AAD5XMA4_9FUNG|nr:hypothetical protein HK100_010483 [Physocladia obscura]
MSTIPQPANAGRWLYLPTAVADSIVSTAEGARADAAPSEYAASIGYSDFFVSELTSDSEDSETGVKLTLSQRRARHEDRRRSGRKAHGHANKWTPKSATTSIATAPTASAPSVPALTTQVGGISLQNRQEIYASPPRSPGGFHVPGTPEALLETLNVLSARISALLTVGQSADPTIRAQQTEGVSAALASAAFVLDSIDAEAGADAATLAGDSKEVRAEKLIVLGDRLRVAGEKMRDVNSLDGLGQTAGAKHAERQKDRRIDTVIRRVEREMKKASI